MRNANLEFRKIKDLDFLYEVNENGTIFRNVKSKKQNKIKLDTHHSEKGYYTTFCRYKGKTKRVMIHKAVAQCWLGDCPDGMEIDHINRDSHDNDYRNLRYVMHAEQMKNRDHTKISMKGSENLQKARDARAKPVRLIRDNEIIDFVSYADASRYLANIYNLTTEDIRWKLKAGRSHIFDYDVIYL